MERVFPLHSPRIAKIEVVRQGQVRRAKLYYLRGTSGKAAKVKARVTKRREYVAKESKKQQLENKQESVKVEPENKVKTSDETKKSTETTNENKDNA